MISLETDTRKLNLINDTSPVLNFCARDKKLSDEFYKEYQNFISWTEHFPAVDVNKLNSKTTTFASILGSKALGVKVLGSGNYKNHIWIVNVDTRPYVIYMSLRGLSIETLPQVTGPEVIKDLKAICQHFGIKPFPWAKYK